MTKEDLEKCHRLHSMSDIETLMFLKTVCNDEDKPDVDKLCDMNYSLFHRNEDKYTEQDYFDLKYKILNKYDSGWEND